MRDNTPLLWLRLRNTRMWRRRKCENERKERERNRKNKMAAPFFSAPLGNRVDERSKVEMTSLARLRWPHGGHSAQPGSEMRLPIVATWEKRSEIPIRHNEEILILIRFCLVVLTTTMAAPIERARQEQRVWLEEIWNSVGSCGTGAP